MSIKFDVSTHSRLKAAGWLALSVFLSSFGFNTQPPEGGWYCYIEYSKVEICFNTQPPEGGWVSRAVSMSANGSVSTHSRLKAAGMPGLGLFGLVGVSTHSRPKAAGKYKLSTS